MGKGDLTEQGRLTGSFERVCGKHVNLAEIAHPNSRTNRIPISTGFSPNLDAETILKRRSWDLLKVTGRSHGRCVGTHLVECGHPRRGRRRLDDVSLNRDRMVARVANLSVAVTKPVVGD